MKCVRVRKRSEEMDHKQKTHYIQETTKFNRQLLLIFYSTKAEGQ